MKDVLGKTKVLKPFAIIGLTVGLLGSTYSVYQTSDKLKKASVLEGGVQTCFNRVNQSYTARMLGDKYSPYLEAAFTNVTEECMADVIAAYEDNLAEHIDKVGKKLNGLANDVHWFHTKVLKSESKALVAGVSINEFGPRFQRIEQGKSSVLESLDSFKMKLSEVLSNLKVTFFSLAFLLPLLLLWEVLERRNLKAKNREIEDEALGELSSEDFTTDSKVEDIIKTALNQNELIYCSKLFSKYNSDIQRKVKSLNLSDKVGKVELLKGSKEEVEAQIERIWQETDGIQADANAEYEIDQEYTVDDSIEELRCSLDTVSSKVVDHLSNKLLAEGVRIELQGEGDLFVKADEETLEQVIYQSLLYAIKASQEGSADKKVIVEGRKLGSLIVTDIQCYGRGFDEQFLNSHKGLKDNSSEMPLALQLTEEFISEVGGKVQYDNIMENSEVVGLRMKITLHAAASDRPYALEQDQKEVRLINVTKGTKRELMEQLKQSI